ncbi:uncharacterized protein Z519_10096 [Cladophialophora bantiana CBS 173.52]|uniref:Uncharacterized protein n=1 Tax=Cladophialophora bantiana (strain ATCC 10958 / CBS 173.52 / CDC B-1940 / NIH 8579) TaxID=1442370 RepID=A0A0D2H7F5_CLAB1|nr:uncharacterized protein Z519_10096 [Cladophialophora bantiana CBS 173.52]KIW89243.1 hypothetical protein Z519_10096 [Cladophialophora bantiana CBS 173.52]
MAASERPRSPSSGRDLSFQNEPHAQLVPGPLPAGQAQSNKVGDPDIDRIISLAISECSLKEGHGHIVTERASSSGSRNTGTAPLSNGATNARKKKKTPILVAWVPACLTAILLALTALYAIRPDLWKSHFINSSPGNAIFVLRALSEATGFLLAITVASAFELVQWLLTVRTGGIPFTEFLCLQEGTGILGLMQLTAGAKSRARTRFWGGLRLLALVLLPVLGVVIMSEVGTVLRFDKVGQTVAPLGFGLGSLNTSVAVTLSPFTDILLGATFSQFLNDPSRAVDITPDASRRRSCALGVDVRGGQTCERAVYLAAGQEEIAAQVTTDAHPQADSWLVEDHQGYVLRFTEGDHGWAFDNGTECRTYYTEALTSTLGAFRLCAKNVAPNQIHARISSCSYSDITSANCGKESAWNSTPTWSTSLSSTFRHAMIAYSRLNGTIISHKFTKMSETVAPLESADLLQAWDNFLGLGNTTDLTTSNILEILGLGAGKFMFPAMIGSMLNSITELSQDNPALQTRGVNALQALLAIPISYCQTGYIERQAAPELPSNVLFTNYDNIILPEGLERNSPVFFAVTRNQIDVGIVSVIAYVVLSGLVLILCFTALGGGAFSERSRHVPDTTAFPVLDFCRHCVVTTKYGVSTAKYPLQGVENYAGFAIREMDVKLAREAANPSTYECRKE